MFFNIKTFKILLAMDEINTCLETSGKASQKIWTESWINWSMAWDYSKALNCEYFQMSGLQKVNRGMVVEDAKSVGRRTVTEYLICPAKELGWYPIKKRVLNNFKQRNEKANSSLLVWWDRVK